MWALFTRIAPGREATAFTAAALAASWAPTDSLRLNAIETVAYSGVTCVTLLAAWLLRYAWTQRSRVLAAGAAAVAVLAVRTYESVVPLLLAAPALLWSVRVGREGRRERLLWAAGWEAAVFAAALVSVAGVVMPSAGSYQMSALSLDLHPAGIAGRLARQLGDHVLPAIVVHRAELAAWPAAAMAFVFASAAFTIARAEGEGAPVRSHLRTAAVGLALALLGWSVFALSPAIRSSARTQFLSAPGVGVMLASLIGAAAALLPARARAAATAVLGAWIVAVGAARTEAMQAEWDSATFWHVQSTSLRRLTAVVPDVAPRTLLVLFDEARAWPATFTFHHAVQYLYEGRAAGHVVGADDFLYPTWFTPQGAWTYPRPEIRGPWHALPTLHGGSEMVVLVLGPDGSVRVLDAWPPALPAEAGTGYAPRSRIVTARQPPSRAILDAR